MSVAACLSFHCYFGEYLPGSRTLRRLAEAILQK